MNKDKIICIGKITDEARLIQLQSEGYRIIQISRPATAGYY